MRKNILALVAGAFMTGAALSALLPVTYGQGVAEPAAGGAAAQPAAAQPAAAPLMAVAGIDRDVILPGKTYLNGRAGYNLNRGGRGGGRRGQGAAVALPPAGPAASVIWSQESGPGTVAFENAESAVTTATFSAPGKYVLKLTANNGETTVSSSLSVTAMLPPPAQQLDAVQTGAFKVNSPLWSSRVKMLICGWIPHCIDEINDSTLPQGGIDNFVEAGKKLAGQPAARHKGYPFSNAWVHQTVESMSIALMVDPQGDKDIIAAQARMRETLDKWIPIILAAQEPDGYLQTRFTLGTQGDTQPRRGRLGAPGAASAPAAQLPPRGTPGHWTAEGRTEHEGYVAGYFIESAINHYNMTGRKDARMYNAAKRLADCWCENIGPGKRDWFDGHQEMEQALVRFGRYVNDIEGKGKGQKYIDLAKFLLDSRTGGSEYDQSHVPVIQQYEAVGHAVRAAYTHSGMADVAVETHDIDYQSAVMSLWDNTVNRKWYVTGGIGSGQTSEGFGPNYELQNTAYAESCSTCGEIFFQYKMNLAYQDSKYVDLYEDSLYNALLGAVDMKGENFNYTNPLVGGNRTAWHNCPCCVGNIPRTLLMIPTWTYARGADSLYVNLFIGSTATVENINGTNVQMVQETDYPWSGKVAITVNPDVEKNFTVKVRVPRRDVSALYTLSPAVSGFTSLALNGAAISNPTMDKGYISITRNWRKGDKINVEFPMQVQRVKAIDQVAADAGRVALRYGPIIYSFESVDNGDVASKVLAADSNLTPAWKPGLFKAINDAPEGVMAISGTYADGSPMMAIPYYARLNRLAAAPVTGAGTEEVAAAPTVAGPGGAGGGAATTPANGGGRAGGRGRGFSRFGASMVWVRDQ